MTDHNLPKCRIVAEFFYETPIRAFFRGFQTNCTTRKVTEGRANAQRGGRARERESRAGNVGKEILDIFYDYCEIEP